MRVTDSSSVTLEGNDEMSAELDAAPADEGVIIYHPVRAQSSLVVFDQTTHSVCDVCDLQEGSAVRITVEVLRGITIEELDAKMQTFKAVRDRRKQVEQEALLQRLQLPPIEA